MNNLRIPFSSLSHIDHPLKLLPSIDERKNANRMMTNVRINVRSVRKVSNINIILKNINVCIQEKNHIHVTNVANDSVIQVGFNRYELIYNGIFAGSYSQHINQRNKFCRPGQVETDGD